MNPLRLVARNYRCFDRLDLELPHGCVAILGENGAGKSSVISAIDLAIFGPESRSLADHLSDVAGPDDELLIELLLEHAGERYRVRRTFSARGRGKTTLDFEWMDGPDGWISRTRESAKETQAVIERTLGLSREMFRASAFLAQGDGAAFTEAQPRDRKRILAEVLGLDRYDTLLDQARVLRRGIENELHQLDGATSAHLALVATKPDVERERADAIAVEVDAADDVADRERAHLELAKRWTDAREKAEQRRTAEAELANARQTRDQLDILNTAADEAVTATAVTRDELATLPAGDIAAANARVEHARTRLEGLRDARSARKLEINRISARELVLEQRRSEWAALVEKAGQIGAAAIALDEEEHASCDRCGQELHGDVRARARQSYVDEAKTYGDRANDINRWMLEEEAAIAAACTSAGYSRVDEAAYDRAKLDEIAEAGDEESAAAAAMRSIQDASAQRARLEERLVALKTTIDQRPTTDALLAADQAVLARERMLATLGEPVDVAAIEREGLAVKAALDVAKTALTTARTTRARLEERLAQIQAAEDQLAKSAIIRVGLHADAELYEALERAFGANGIPMLVVEATAIPQIENDANRILAELGTSFRVELRTQAALKSGDGLRDTLDIVIQTDESERPYETFSGGEKTRLNLGLRIALARLLAHRRGADSRLLAIDEPEFLDEPGTAALVGVLQQLHQAGDFDRVYLISHVPALRDSFDDVLTVTKGDDGRSSVAEAAVFEEIAA